MVRALVTGWVVGILVAFPLYAGEGEVTLKGTVSGAVCGAVEHMICTHKPDPQHHYELLGLFTQKGKFLFLINVPQKVLRKINRSPVVVKGRPVEGYSALMVEEITSEGKQVFSAKEGGM